MNDATDCYIRPRDRLDGIGRGLLRRSVGLEDVEDLWAELGWGFQAAK